MQPAGSDVTILLIAVLLAKHFLCDFVLQTPYQIRHKGIYGHPGGLIHAGLHAVATAAVLSFFPVAWSFVAVAVIVEFAIHYHLDWGKDRITRNEIGPDLPLFWRLLGFDQFLHQLTYLGIAALA